MYIQSIPIGNNRPHPMLQDTHTLGVLFLLEWYSKLDWKLTSAHREARWRFCRDVFLRHIDDIRLRSPREEHLDGVSRRFACSHTSGDWQGFSVPIDDRFVIFWSNLQSQISMVKWTVVKIASRAAICPGLLLRLFCWYLFHHQNVKWLSCLFVCKTRG